MFLCTAFTILINHASICPTVCVRDLDKITLVLLSTSSTLYEILAPKITKPNVIKEKLQNLLSYEERACKMLMKLTPGSLFLGSSQFFLLPQIPQRMSHASIVVKNDAKIILYHPYFVTHPVKKRWRSRSHLLYFLWDLF